MTLTFAVLVMVVVFLGNSSPRRPGRPSYGRVCLCAIGAVLIAYIVWNLV